MIYGDSVEGDGSGSNILFGSEGDDILYANSETGNGSGHDWIDAGPGTNTLYGDTRTGEGSGHDMLTGGEGTNLMYADTAGTVGTGHDTLFIREGTDTVAGEGQDSDTVVQTDGSTVPSYSYEVNGHIAHYKQDPDTGQVMVWDRVFGGWDVVGEPHWDRLSASWVTNMGREIVAEYADKTLR